MLKLSKIYFLEGNQKHLSPHFSEGNQQTGTERTSSTISNTRIHSIIPYARV